ncbi:hypothetical protein BJV82DRAFT_543654 [Fennellomyces sp. T-0311]|nr:hypothetical protein BJV82DRAFT_543654 [Fennellomyces sp. T-0311]
MSNILINRKNYLKLVLDETTLYLGNQDGTIIVRGEAIVNFTKDTAIQGPIELEFEGLQRWYPWRDLMGAYPLGKPIETKVHVIELSLLPPNSHGIMPAGIQRFPFEFPLPGSLPTTVSIPDRLDISYKLTATLRKAGDESPASWLKRFGGQQKMVASVPLRLVRAIEPIPSLTFGAVPPPARESEQTEQQPLIAPSEEELNIGRHRRTSLDRYFDLDHATEDTVHPSFFGKFHLGLALDEQHDRLAYSMAGRSVDNWSRPLDGIEYGLRYRLGIDRTAIAIGTSVGVEVLLEPMVYNMKIRSIVTRITETRDYTMKVPGDHASAVKGQPEKRETSETLAMVLKWAYGYPTEHDESSSCTSSSDSGQKKKQSKRTTLSRRYRHHRSHWSDELHRGRCLQAIREKSEHERAGPFMYSSSAYSPPHDFDEDQDDPKSGELLNLKSLDQPVHVGEYFEGRFVMPVPTCDHFLRPTTAHESITIRHWLDLIVAIECDGKLFKITLTTPVRLLDCRLVAADDERQTILPPPPSYETIEVSDGATTNHTEFWVQRWPITQDATWGVCRGCPCKQKRMKEAANEAARLKSSEGSLSKRPMSLPPSPTSSTVSPPPSLQPSWGPPPTYSER